MSLLWLALAFAVTLLVTVERLRPFLDRALKVVENRYSADKTVQGIPADLMGIALAYDQEWAQTEVLDGMRLLFEQYGNWDQVRLKYVPPSSTQKN